MPNTPFVLTHVLHRYVLPGDTDGGIGTQVLGISCPDRHVEIEISRSRCPDRWVLDQSWVGHPQIPELGT